MALPASGPISMSMVNTELGIPATTVITLNDAAVRTLFNKSSGAIALSDGYGKSAVSAPVFPTTILVNFVGGGYQEFLTNTTASNYSVNDRTVGYWNGIDMGASTAASANDSKTNTFATASGTGVTYEWQFLTQQRMHPTNCTAGQRVPLVASAQTWSGPSGYDDSISGASTNSLTMTGYAYDGTVANHGIAGYWRLKASNSAGATYTAWIQVIKSWGAYDYNCNCTCPCGTNDCNCDENNENCSQCCDNCFELCDTCSAYTYSDGSQYVGCNW